MSPELFNYKPYSYKSDIWSLGCVLYEICNLKHAFNAQTINALAIKIMKGNFAAVSSVYSKDIRDLIHSMLVIDQKNRPSIKTISQNPLVKTAVAKYLVKLVREADPSELDETFIDSLKIQVVKFGISSLIQLDSDSDDRIKSVLLGNRKEALKVEELKYLKLSKEQELRNELSKKQKLEHEIKNLKEMQQRFDSVRNDSEYTAKSLKYNYSETQKPHRSQIDSASYQPSEHLQSEFTENISNDPDDYDDFDFVEDIDEITEIPKELIHSKIDQVQKKLIKNTVVIEGIQHEIERMGEKLERTQNGNAHENFDDSFNDSKEFEEFVPNFSAKTIEAENVDFEGFKFIPLVQERIAFAQS